MAFGRPTMLGMVSLALALDLIVGLHSKFPRQPIIHRGHRSLEEIIGVIRGILEELVL